MEKMIVRRIQAYHPINSAILRALESQPDTAFQLNGEPLDLIEIVAKVEDVSETGLRLEFRFSDEYGEFVGVVYRKPGSTPPALQGYDVGRRGYAVIIGTAKRFFETLTIVIARLTPVYEFITVLHHRLHVIWAYGIRTKKIVPGSKNKPEVENKPEITVVSKTELTEPQASIMQALRSKANILNESNKIPLAKQLGMPVNELERNLAGLTLKGYLYKDEITGRYVVMDGN